MLQARSGTREGVRGGGGKGLPCHVAVGLRSGCGRELVRVNKDHAGNASGAVRRTSAFDITRRSSVCRCKRPDCSARVQCLRRGIRFTDGGTCACRNVHRHDVTRDRQGADIGRSVFPSPRASVLLAGPSLDAGTVSLFVLRGTAVLGVQII